jgi:hypothetical protein
MAPGVRAPSDPLLETNHMGSLVFLFFAVAVSVLGVFVLRLRQRGPKSVSSGVDRFSKGMQAIAPLDSDRRGRP